MYVNARFISFFINILNLFSFITNVTTSVSKERERRHLFPLLGYLHGYKIGQNFALQLPPFVLSPIIIVPSVNQQQSVNVQKSSSDDNYQEIGGTFQNISPARLVSTSIEINNEARQPIKSEINKDLLHENNTSFYSDKDTLRQVNINESITTETEDINEYSTTTPYAEITETELENLQIKNVTKLSGLYPNAAYNNDKLSTLSITTAPLQYNLTVPNAEDKWPNFSQPLSEFENNTNKYINSDNLNFTVENIIVYPTTELSIMTKSYPYPNPGYNEKLDQFSITTNSYTNEEVALPPTYDDRWQRFSSLRKSNPSSGFRPLAGLYYDGFLHKPLTKEMEFRLHHINNYYYNG